MCRKLTFDPFRITGIVYDGVDDSIRFHAGLAASEKGKIGVCLIDAHRALDAAVDLCYRPAGFKTELERLKFLFDLYRKYTEPLMRTTAQLPRKKKKDSSGLSVLV